MNQPNNNINPVRRPPYEASPAEHVQGTIQGVDTMAREITVRLLPRGVAAFDVPPDCPIFLHGERIKLRMVQSQDHVNITFARRRGALVAQVLEVQPNAIVGCSSRTAREFE